MINIRQLFLVTVLPFLSGCGGLINSKYSAPPMILPEHWQSVTINEAAGYPYAWQEFNDPLLISLQKQTLLRNADVELAATRVKQAALSLEQTSVQFEPAVSGNIGASSGRPLDYHNKWNRSVSASLGIDSEIDLWGIQTRQRDAAALSVKSAEQSLRQTYLLLMESVSDNYWLLGVLNERLTFSLQDEETARATLQLVMLRWQAGKVSAVDVVNARQNMISQETNTRQLKRQLIEARNTQSLLAGMPVGKILAEPSALHRGKLPQVRAGLPVNILARRPDVSQAELALRQALTNVDISHAELYPGFSLSTSLGTSSTELMSFISNPVASLSAAFSLPFLNWRAHELSIKQAQLSYQQEVIHFRQTLYAAMVEVDNTLTLQAQLREEQSQLEELLQLAYRSETLSRIRYQAGAAPLNFWLDAQQQRRQAEYRVTENRFSLYQALARLSVVSGGAQ
ncbi:hypothetical protein WM46_15480 [Citrobacter freundii complex sp. CFNIH2]|uniref:TolC family protein n=1 Tax=Citrobacter freundii complex sp. CFNIH2 TaxID=2066049 RepID=UPI000C86A3A9|nr:TolC family protein [Citrobacter freundii complex sp. CFNIH2]AUO66039.1 hypothetical protein WM46_15480 [Citrobacter freundii complex sp. CFNIH2]